MDCQTFDDLLLDALYPGELDEHVAADFAAHAAEHPECASKLAKLQRTREAFRPVLEQSPPSSLEARVLDAATSAADRRGGEPATGATAKIFTFIARPHFAVAAGLLLAIGGALFMSSSRREAAAPMAANSEPGAPPPMQAASASPAPPPPPTATAALPMPTPVPAADTNGSALALNEQAPAPPSQGAGLARKEAAASKKAPASGKPGLTTPTFAQAEAAYATGRYEDALALYEAAARGQPGTDIASRAKLGAARCYEKLGQASTARARYQALKSDSNVGDDASRELDRLESPKVKAAKPAATAVPAAAEAQ